MRSERIAAEGTVAPRHCDDRGSRSIYGDAGRLAWAFAVKSRVLGFILGGANHTAWAFGYRSRFS